jgi:hypothetical protein
MAQVMVWERLPVSLFLLRLLFVRYVASGRHRCLQCAEKEASIANKVAALCWLTVYNTYEPLHSAAYSAAHHISVTFFVHVAHHPVSPSAYMLAANMASCISQTCTLLSLGSHVGS